MAVTKVKTMFKIPVTQMKAFGNVLARVMYPQLSTKATTRTNAKRTMVLVLRPKLLVLL